MYYLISSTLALVILLIVALYRINRKLLKLGKENEILNEKVNALHSELATPKQESIAVNLIAEDNSLSERLNEANDMIVPAEIERFKLEINTEIKTKQQHYYIVKEIIKDRINKAIISSKEFEFIDEKIYTAKSNARFFYDSKIQSKNDADDTIEISEYELYIVNDVYFDTDYLTESKKEVNTNDNIIKYLLLDTKGKEQIDGKNFESFVLKNTLIKSSKITESKENPNSKNNLHNQEFVFSTRNSFLDGNYKD